MKYALEPKMASWRVVDGEAVIIHLETSYYYHLNRTGTFLWKLLAQSPHREDELVSALAADVQRPADTVAPDVKALLESLVAEHLIQAEPEE